METIKEIIEKVNPRRLKVIEFKDDAETLTAISEFTKKEIRVDYSNPKKPELRFDVFASGTALLEVGDFVTKNSRGYIDYLPAKQFKKEWSFV